MWLWALILEEVEGPYNSLKNGNLLLEWGANLECLTTSLQPSTRIYGVEAGVDCICVDVTEVLRAL